MLRKAILAYGALAIIGAVELDDLLDDGLVGVLHG